MFFFYSFCFSVNGQGNVFNIFLCFPHKMWPFLLFYVCVTCFQAVFQLHVCFLQQNKSITCHWCIRLFSLINNVNIAVLLVTRVDMRWRESLLFVLSVLRENVGSIPSAEGDWCFQTWTSSRDIRGLSQVSVRDHVQARKNIIVSHSFYSYFLFSLKEDFLWQS